MDIYGWADSSEVCVDNLFFLRLGSNSDFNDKLRRLVFFSFQSSLFGWVSDQTGYSDQIFQRARCTCRT